jgi:AbrB family looped-hinge helix DNA binding protein
MDTAYAKFSSRGQLVVPAAMRDSLGIEAGTPVTIRLEGKRLILEPQTLAAKLRLIEELRGLTAGGPSMTDSLLARRRKERAIELAKDGW